MFSRVVSFFSGCTATLSNGAFRRLDPVLETINDSLFHALHSRLHLSSGGINRFCFIEYFSFHCCSSFDLPDAALSR
jgi:hypothetical protein